MLEGVPIYQSRANISGPKLHETHVDGSIWALGSKAEPTLGFLVAWMLNLERQIDYNFFVVHHMEA